jgi:hypothetical protein
MSTSKMRCMLELYAENLPGKHVTNCIYKDIYFYIGRIG